MTSVINFKQSKGNGSLSSLADDAPHEPLMNHGITEPSICKHPL